MNCPHCGTEGQNDSAYIGGRGYVSQVVCPKALEEFSRLFDTYGIDAAEANQTDHPCIIERERTA